MIDVKKRAVTILDLILIFMTASWITFGVFRGITVIELIYNRIYVIVAISTSILNIRIINENKG